jgi:ElaB/YqjD/DUF883 family membrane-anchored ribosome-binding protein
MTRHLSILFAIVCTVALVGCGKKKSDDVKPVEEPTNAAMEDAMKGASDAVNETIGKANEKVEELKAKADEAVTKANETIKATTSQFDQIVADVKANIAANSFDQALAKLKEGFSLPNLTGDQKGVLQQLQESIQQAMANKVTGDATKQAEGTAAEATKKVGGLLNFGK